MNRFKKFSQKYPAEAAAVGRLLAGYADLEISLMHCVQMARGGDLDTVLKAMYGRRGEMQRINTAHTLGKPAYDSLGLESQFSSTIDDMKCCLSVRNCYAHSLWHDAYAAYLAVGNLEELAKVPRYLAFVNLEELAKVPTKVTDLLGVTIRYVDIGILTQQEEYLDFVDHSLSFLNHQGRYLKGDLASNPVPAPAPHARPPLHRP